MAWSDIFIGASSQSSSEQVDNYNRLQAELAKKVAERQASATLTPTQYAFYTAETGGLEDQDAAALEGLKEGAMEGLNNVLNAPGKIVGTVGQGAGQALWGVLKNIPWWAYAAALGALFVWMGGLSLLRGRLAKA
jgi:hypothetical protein